MDHKNQDEPTEYRQQGLYIYIYIYAYACKGSVGEHP